MKKVIVENAEFSIACALVVVSAAAVIVCSIVYGFGSCTII